MYSDGLDQTPHYAYASKYTVCIQGLHYLPLSQKYDARLIQVEQRAQKIRIWRENANCIGAVTECRSHKMHHCLSIQNISRKLYLHAYVPVYEGLDGV